MKNTAVDSNGAEYAIETGTGKITELRPPLDGKRNAYAQITADGLKYPVGGSVDTQDSELWEAVQQAYQTRAEVEYRVETHRGRNADPQLPIADVHKDDKFRRLVRISTVGSQAAERPVERTARHEEHDPGPQDESDYGRPIQPPQREPQNVNGFDYHAEFKRLSDLIDAGLKTLREQSYTYAEAETEYRKAKAKAWLDAPTRQQRGEWTAAQREAHVNAETADLREARDIADGLRQAALEAVRSRRAQISSIQSLLAAEREEAAFARTGPRMEP